jgi:hypothetical protein
MGLFDFFKKKRKPDPLAGLTLRGIRPGFFVDYDMKTWEVTAYSAYDWGDGDLTYEWQLKSHDETIYLEREPDDEDYWTISRKVPVSKIGDTVLDRIIADDDPPEEIVVDSRRYTLDESGGGHYFRNAEGIGTETGRELIKWDFIDDSETATLTIERWGEKEFEVSMGTPVEEYQFTDILPCEEKP